MHRLTMLLIFLSALAVCLAESRAVRACPSCNDALSASSGPDDDDPLLEARAFNQSILFMVAAPYVTLAGLGFVVYRSVRAGRKGEIAPATSSVATPA